MTELMAWLREAEKLRMERLFLMVGSTILTAAIAWGLDARPSVCGEAPVSAIESGTAFRLNQAYVNGARLSAGCVLRVWGEAVGPGTYLYERQGRRLRGPEGDVAALDCGAGATVGELATDGVPGVELVAMVVVRCGAKR